MVNAFAFEPEEFTTIVPPKLHAEYGLESSMSIQQIANRMDIPLNMFKIYFRLNLRDTRIDDSTLSSQNISIDEVYQYYYMEKYGFNDFSTLIEVSKYLHIPFKSMAKILDIDPQDSKNRSLTVRDLGYETLDMLQYEDEFNDRMLNYNSTLTVLGMCVTFTALILVAFIVSKLILLSDKKTETVKVSTPIGTISSKDPNILNFEDAVVAIVAAVHKFKSEIAIDHKILLTYRRIDVSMWQASGKIDMPNKNFQPAKK